MSSRDLSPDELAELEAAQVRAERPDAPAPSLGPPAWLLAVEAARAAQETAVARAPKRPCAGCGALVPDFRRYRSGASPLGPYVATEVCHACDAQRDHDEQFRPALASLPPRFDWARLDAPELVARAGGRAPVVRAAKSLDAPRVALIGQPGSGKTSLAVAMLRAVIDAGRDRFAERAVVERARRACFVSAYGLAKARAEHGNGKGEAEVVKRAIRASVLVVDDLGSEREGYRSAVEEVLYDRHNDGSPTWVTTWMNHQQVSDRYSGGIARRVFEDGVVIRFAGGAS